MTAPKQRGPVDERDTPFRPDRLALTMQELADAIGVSYETVAELVRDGAIEHIPAKSRKIIPMWAVRKYLRMDQDPTALNSS